METKGGIKTLHMEEKDGKVVSVQVDMGVPRLTGKLPEPIVVEGRELEFVGMISRSRSKREGVRLRICRSLTRSTNGIIIRSLN